MSRRAQSMPSMLPEKPKRKPIVTVICYSWKILTCVFSHVTLVSLVVVYCIAGAVLFEHLEAENEKNVKLGIRGMRSNVTDDLWDMTTTFDYLHQDNWTRQVERRLENFEKAILIAMKTNGWDGNENEKQMQWTFFGALFYSIIVITTIGYGHIAPKTAMGKISTIFYAILGIPLMLLCLSNIGDIMATSFRFLYWRVCCYVCTREPKKSRRRANRMSVRQPQRVRSQPPPNMRRSIRISQRSADSGFATKTEYEQSMMHAHSDPQLRYGRHSDRQANRSRYRGDIQCETYDERNRERNYCENDRNPSSRRRQPNYDYDRDDMYNERNDRRNDRDDSPEFDGRQHPSRRISTNDRDIDPYDDPPNPKRSPRDFSRQKRFSHRTRDRLQDRHTVERERYIKRPNQMDPIADFDQSPSPARSQSTRSLRAHSTNREINRDYAKTMPSPRQKPQPERSPKSRAKSVDPRMMRKAVEPDQDGIMENKYAFMVDSRESNPTRSKRPANSTRSQSMPRHHNNNNDRVDRLEIPETPIVGGRRSRDRDFDDEYDDDDDGYQMFPERGGGDDPSYGQTVAPRRERAALPPSPRIMSPMGFAVHRQAKLRYPDEDSFFDEDSDYYGEGGPPRNRPVPIWLCVFLVVSYIIAGAFLFSEWEHWSFLDSAYFCFITLTTIGFGDFVPAQGVKENSQVSIALCSLYLLFGISLLAMSFNLVQEEVIANVKSVARRLGILKEQEIVD